MDFKATEIVSISVAAIAFAGSVVSAFYAYSNRNREMDIKLIEIGIGILRTDPKETGISPAREWALRVIEENSGLKFNADDRQALLNKPLPFHPSNVATIDPRMLPLLEAMSDPKIKQQLDDMIKTLADQIAKENKRAK